jgi:hypothetical protein
MVPRNSGVGVNDLNGPFHITHLAPLRFLIETNVSDYQEDWGDGWLQAAFLAASISDRRAEVTMTR